VELRLAYAQRIDSEVKGWFSTAASHAMDELDCALDLGWKSSTETALKGLINAMQKEGAFTTRELDKLPGLLQRVPTEYAALREQVSEKIPSAKIFTPKNA